MQKIFNISLRSINTVIKFLAIFFLMPTSQFYGTGLAIVFGIFIFCYRFLYFSVGLHSSRKRDILKLHALKSIIVKIQIYVNFLFTVVLLLIFKSFEGNILWLILLAQFSITLAIVLAFNNEIVRFSAKSLLPDYHRYYADFARVILEIFVTILFVAASINMVSENIFIYFLIGLNLLISCLIFIYFASDRKLSKPKLEISYKWVLFLSLSGILFGLDRSIVALFYHDPIIYLSLVAIIGPIVGMCSYIFVWLYRNSMQRETRLIFMIATYFFTWLVPYLMISLELSIFASSEKFSFWISLFSEYSLFIFFYGVAILLRDFYMQDVFEKNKDKAFLVIIFPVSAFIFLLAISAAEILLLLVPITIYVIAERIFSATKYI